MAEIDLGKVTFGEEELRQVIGQIMSEYSSKNIDVLGSFSEKGNRASSNYNISVTLPCKYGVCFLVVIIITQVSNYSVIDATADAGGFGLMPLCADALAKVLWGYNSDISLLDKGAEYSVTVNIGQTNAISFRSGFLLGVR